MPLSYDGFMKKTNNKGFTSEEQALLSSFGVALKKVYKSMCEADKDSAEYKSQTEVREALGAMQGNSILQPSPDDEEEERKRKWDEDMQRLVGFINMLRSGRNLSYFSDHPVGGQSRELKNGRQYFSLLELLNDKLEANIDIDEHRELFSGHHQPPTAAPRSEEPKEEKKEEKPEPLNEEAIRELKAKILRERQETLKEWAYVGSFDDGGEQDTFQQDLLKAAKGLNAKQWRLFDGSRSELSALKNAIGEYNIYLMEKSDGKEVLSEEKYLGSIIKSAESYISKKRGDDPLHPENNKPDDWKPLFKNSQKCFESAKEVLEVAKARLAKIEGEKKKAAEKQSELETPKKTKPRNGQKKNIRGGGGISKSETGDKTVNTEQANKSAIKKTSLTRR
ncbi:MAG: hypothetical protein IKW87_10095 [Ruminococcus sp.]|nr:hypothetical protein [Ruminococcus sp.]